MCDVNCKTAMRRVLCLDPLSTTNGFGSLNVTHVSVGVVENCNASIVLIICVHTTPSPIYCYFCCSRHIFFKK